MILTKPKQIAPLPSAFRILRCDLDFSFSNISNHELLIRIPVNHDWLGPYCLIPLSQNLFAKVDPGLYLRLSQFRWHCLSDKSTQYAARTVWLDDKSHKIFMHRLVARTPPHLVCDHINGDTLDNRFANLRNCTTQQNNFNSRPSPGKSSKFKGVFYSKREKKFRACIKHNGIRYHLGYFDNEIDAALAYDQKAIELFGPFAHLNFPNQ